GIRDRNVTGVQTCALPILLGQLDSQDFAAARQTTLRADALRDEFNTRIEGIRADMLAQVGSAAAKVTGAQQRAIIISGVVTAIEIGRASCRARVATSVLAT